MEEKIERLVLTNYELEHFIGNIFVAKEDKVIFNKCYGLSDYKNQIPHTPSSKFLIGSLSKQFIAVAIMKLQEEGKLQVNHTINKYIDNYSYGSNITIHHLLTHSSGIINYTETLEYYQNREKQHSPEEIIDYFRHKELMFDPGSACYYSNSGYVLLARIIEGVSELPYDVYLEQTIFKPLNMNHSGVFKKGTNIDSPMIGYTGTMDGYKAGPTWNISLFYGAFNMYSTVEDLYKWDRSLYTNVILNSASRNELFKKHIGNFGYGWFINEDHVYHSGRITGFNSLICRYIEEDVVIIILSNRTYYGSRIESICNDITSILHEKPITLPRKKELLEYGQVDIQKYIGEYIEPNMDASFFTIIINQNLCFYEGQNPDYKLVVKSIKESVTEDIFSLGMSPGTVSFLKNSEGNVTTAILSEDGFSVSLEKTI